MPVYVELTSLDVEENKRIVKSNDVNYPIGRHGIEHYSYEPIRSAFELFVQSLITCCDL